ncbi:hypothetical protein TNCV_1215171 [Trichonephila clavipes]|nr:hypothetical protein TNCV_1215171 [Trichonephila clavipes]
MYSAFAAWGYSKKSRRTLSAIVWLVEGEERWEAPGSLPRFFPSKWGGTEQKLTVNCMVLKANDRCKFLSLAAMNFVGLDLTSSGSTRRSLKKRSACVIGIKIRVFLRKFLEESGGSRTRQKWSPKLMPDLVKFR